MKISTHENTLVCCRFQIEALDKQLEDIFRDIAASIAIYDGMASISKVNRNCQRRINTLSSELAQEINDFQCWFWEVRAIQRLKDKAERVKRDIDENLRECHAEITRIATKTMEKASSISPTIKNNIGLRLHEYTYQATNELDNSCKASQTRIRNSIEYRLDHNPGFLAAVLGFIFSLFGW